MTQWTPDETQRLYSAAQAGVRHKTIARELDRSLHSVESKLSQAYELGLLPPRKIRPRYVPLPDIVLRVVARWNDDDAPTATQIGLEVGRGRGTVTQLLMLARRRGQHVAARKPGRRGPRSTVCRAHTSDPRTGESLENQPPP